MIAGHMLAFCGLFYIVVIILPSHCTQIQGCSDGEVRLVGGRDHSEGRVEVCLGNEWGTVCADDSWDANNAEVVCQQLNFTSYANVTRLGLGSEEPSLNVSLSEVECAGTEMRLTDCPAERTTHNCSSSEVGGVRCNATPAAVPCGYGDIRLTDGCDSREGRVELCINGTWGTVCDDFWDNSDAQVVCRQLGYSSTGALGFSRALYGIGTGPIYLDTVACKGNETTLLDCPRRPIRDHDCVHFEDASVSCTKANCTEGDIRLAEGSFYEGRVEVCQSGLWGTVCDDLWGEEDAFVVCGQLGLRSEGAVAVDFGPGCGPIFFDNVECTREEKMLDACSRAVFGDCYHDQDAGVRCALTNVSLLPFGAEVNDNSTFDGNSSSLGPFDLPIPVVYYLRQEYQIYASISGEIIFQQESNFNTTTVASITPQWCVDCSENILYARVTRDESTLRRVRATIEQGKQETSNFQPTLAFIATWHSNETDMGTLQAIVSTNGVASFLTYLFDDGHGIRILEQQDILVFGAGDRQRRSTYRNTVIDLQVLRKVMNSFRIDGHCITEDSPENSCNLDSYAINCRNSCKVVSDEVICRDSFSASTCRCHNGSGDSETRLRLMSGDTARNQSSNVTGANETMTSELCDATSISCVSGSVASPCIPPGALDTGYSGCYPTLLPCYFEENCLSETELNDCSSSGLTVFGEGAGDIRGGPLDDEAFGPITIDIPIIYFNTLHDTFYLSTNCLLSFENRYDTYMLCGALPCAPEAIIAPIWTDLDFRFSGVMFYRTSQDPMILNQIATVIADVNSALSEYQPKQAVIVTWFEARAHYEDDDPTLGEYIGTIQLVVSTDGTNSFASFIYENPVNIQNVSQLGNTGEEGGVIGFDGGERTSGADYGQLLLMANQSLQTVNSFRIDGLCVTTIQPGEACSLEAHTAQCANFSAMTCDCKQGFEYSGTSCIDINECIKGFCHKNADCSNTFGSFECACKIGFTGDGMDCEDIDECTLGFCSNVSTCIDTEGSYTCVCIQGYEPVGQNMCREIIRENLPVMYIVLISVVSSFVVLLAIVLIALMILTAFLNKRKARRSLRNRYGVSAENDYPTISKLVNMKVQSSFDLQVKKELVVHSGNLTLGKTLGQGEFGIVYRGSLKKGFKESHTETVAVKTLRGFMQDERVTEMLKECAKMKELDHPNVLTLKGVCLDGGPAPFIIMPYMANGSLLNYLKENREALVLDVSTTKLDDISEVQKKLLDICIQVAKGMEYLASKRFIHRDLAARNCMIDAGLVIKVADFGLSESLGATKEYFRQDGEDAVKLPVKWLAIESINDRIFSEKTDIWSFGVTCWEVFSGGKAPYPGIHPRDLVQQLEGGYRMEKPKNAACTDKVYTIMMQCWKQNPKHRPNFSEVVNDLSEFLGLVADYFSFEVSANASTLV